MCNVKYVVDLNPKESGERSSNGSGDPKPGFWVL